MFRNPFMNFGVPFEVEKYDRLTKYLMVSREVKSIEPYLSKEIRDLSLLLKYMWMTLSLDPQLITLLKNFLKK